MSSNPYRNSRNSYRRRRQKEGRVLVALVVVTIMAAGIMGLYGVINLFTDSSLSLKHTQTASSVIQPISDENNGSTLQGNNVVGQGSSLQTESKVTASASTGGIETKPDNAAVDKKTDDSKKVDIKKLVTAEKSAEEEHYKDTVFVGDSRTQGLQINAGLKNPDFFAGRGLNVKNARTEKVVKNAKGKTVTVIEALKDKKYRKVYICYGINELGWPYTNIFADEYKKTIEAIKEIQPDAEIVVQGILPVTEKKSKSDKIFNMKNIKKFNKVIKEMAEEIGVTYVDVSPAVSNKKGFLPNNVTPDGVHMDREYCKRILAYIVNMNY